MQAEVFYNGNGVDSGWKQMKNPNWLVYFLSETSLIACTVPIWYLLQNLAHPSLSNNSILQIPNLYHPRRNLEICPLLNRAKTFGKTQQRRGKQQRCKSIGDNLASWRAKAEKISIWVGSKTGSFHSYYRLSSTRSHFLRNPFTFSLKKKKNLALETQKRKLNLK